MTMIRIFVLFLTLVSTSVFAESYLEQWLQQCKLDNILNPSATVYCYKTYSATKSSKDKFIANFIPLLPFIGPGFLSSKTGDSYKENATQSQSHQLQKKSNKAPKPLPYY